MINPKQKARQLWKNLEHWTPDPSWHVEVGTDAPVPTRLAETRVLHDGKPWVRFGFALREWLIAAARLDEFLSTVGQFWPSLKSWAEGQRDRLKKHMRMARLPNFSLNSGAGWAITQAIVRVIEESEIADIDRSLPMDLEAIEPWIYQLAEFREARALEEWFRRQGQQFESSVSLLTETLSTDRSVAESSEFAEVMRWAMSNYLLSEWLFSWVVIDQRMSQRTVYGPLFKIRGDMLNMRQRDNLLASIAGQIDIEPVERENARSIIQRVSEVVAEMGYDELIRAVTSYGGQSGPNSMLGNTAPVNLIPGEGRGQCCPIVVAMASGSNRAKKLGFPQVMRELRAHLIRCAGRTKLAIVITDVWDPKLVDESRKDLLAHQGNGLQLIVLLAVGTTVAHVPIDLRIR